MRFVHLASLIALLQATNLAAAPTAVVGGPSDPKGSHTLPVVADPVSEADGAQPGAAAIVKRALESRQILFALPPGNASGAGRRIDVAVKIDGRPYLREAITVPPGSPAVTVELLARWPGTLDFLYRMAAREGTDVRFTIQVDREPVRELTFNQVIEGSRALKQQQQRQRRQESRIEFLDPKANPRLSRSVASKSLVLDNVCAAGCQQQCDLCQPDDCVTRDPCDTCDACSSQYNSCIESCLVCVPDVSYYQTPAYLVGAASIGSDCTANAEYAVLNLTYEYSYVQHTDYCDHTQSDVVLWTSQFSITCEAIEFSGTSCPGDPPTNTCP